MKTLFIRNKKEKTKVTSIRNKKGDITTDFTDNKWVIKKYYEELYADKLDNFEEMNKSFGRHKALKLSLRKKSDNLNGPISIKVIECIVKILPKKKNPIFIGKFY